LFRINIDWFGDKRDLAFERGTRSWLRAPPNDKHGTPCMTHENGKEHWRRTLFCCAVGGAKVPTALDFSVKKPERGCCVCARKWTFSRTASAQCLNARWQISPR